MKPKIPHSYLIAVETDDMVRVVYAHDREDWVAEFSKANDFPAQQWADRMMALYVRREIERDKGKQSLSDSNSGG